LPTETRGHTPAALVPLEPALTLAEPKDYIRTFVDERPPMATLLEAAAKHGILEGYVRQLVARFRAPKHRAPPNRLLSTSSRSVNAGSMCFG
jgi:LuxR family transcriptional regulator, maltose regulon positive regulatory protein